MKLSLIGMLLVLIFDASAQGEPTVILGIDENLDGQVPLVDRPNSTESRDRFVARLRPGQIGQDFESVGPRWFETGDGISFTPNVVAVRFSGYVHYAEVTNTATYANDGVYASSNDHYLYTTTEADTPFFSLSFSAPVTAFGFHAMDANDDFDPDYEAQIGLRLLLTHPDGRVTDVFNGDGLGTLPDGSAAFVGVLSPNDPFVSVDFQLDSDFGDGGTGIDDVYVAFAVPEPAYPRGLLVVMGFLAARTVTLHFQTLRCSWYWATLLMTMMREH